MTIHGLRGSLLVALLIGSVALSGGCGGQETGTHVQVDKEKEAAVLKAMGGYMEKQQGKMKSNGRPNR
jgi:hypothetical protein